MKIVKKRKKNQKMNQKRKTVSFAIINLLGESEQSNVDLDLIIIAETESDNRTETESENVTESETSLVSSTMNGEKEDDEATDMEQTYHKGNIAFDKSVKLADYEIKNKDHDELEDSLLRIQEENKLNIDAENFFIKSDPSLSIKSKSTKIEELNKQLAQDSETPKPSQTKPKSPKKKKNAKKSGQNKTNKASKQSKLHQKSTHKRVKKQQEKEINPNFPVEIIEEEEKKVSKPKPSRPSNKEDLLQER